MMTSYVHMNASRLKRKRWLISVGSEFDISTMPPIDPDALAVLNLIEEAGYEAWFVGGWVRDAVLGRPAHDIDIASRARAEEIVSIATRAGLHVFETGIAHGTVTVLGPIAHHPLEITTYRLDGPYHDGRHPDYIEIARTIEQDLARRDFTINAIAYHPTRGLCDPFGGLNDIAMRRIRTVGEAAQRFREDGLRILRACRFVSQLGFSLDPTTLDAMVAGKSRLANVSIERITHELDEFVCGAYAGKALLETVDVLSFVLPELSPMKNCAQDTPHHIYDVLEHTAHVIENTPPDLLVRWAALCHDMGKPAAAFYDKNGVEHFYGHGHISVEIARGIFARLQKNSAFTAKALLLIKHHDDTIAETKSAVKRALRTMKSLEMFDALCSLKRADALAQAPSSAPRAELAERLCILAHEIVASNEAFSVKNLAINGHDLQACGFEDGPALGALLNQLVDAVIDEDIPNDRDALLEFAQKTIGQD